MTIRVLDPTAGEAAATGKLAPRLPTLKGKTIGFISNGKEGTKGFFAHLDRLLREEHGVAKVVMRTKSNYSAPADAHIVAEIRNWDAVISGIGD
jgi:hypothetical protein